MNTQANPLSQHLNSYFSWSPLGASFFASSASCAVLSASAISARASRLEQWTPGMTDWNTRSGRAQWAACRRCLSFKHCIRQLLDTLLDKLSNTCILAEHQPAYAYGALTSLTGQSAGFWERLMHKVIRKAKMASTDLSLSKI